MLGKKKEKDEREQQIDTITKDTNQLDDWHTGGSLTLTVTSHYARINTMQLEGAHRAPPQGQIECICDDSPFCVVWRCAAPPPCGCLFVCVWFVLEDSVACKTSRSKFPQSNNKLLLSCEPHKSKHAHISKTHTHSHTQITTREMGEE